MPVNPTVVQRLYLTIEKNRFHAHRTDENHCLKNNPPTVIIIFSERLIIHDIL